MKIRGTTILAVKHRGKVTVAGDGQVTLDTTVMKHGARKVRRLYHNQVIVGFAGATADAFTLFDRFDQKLEQYKGRVKELGSFIKRVNEGGGSDEEITARFRIVDPDSKRAIVEALLTGRADRAALWTIYPFPSAALHVRSRAA